MENLKEMDMLSELMGRISNIDKHIKEERAKQGLLQKQKNDKEALRKKKIEDNEVLLMQKTLLNDTSKEARNQGKEILADMATLAVQSVFGDNMYVDINITEKDGIPQADVTVFKKYDYGVIEVDPSGNDGGGLADIVSLALFMGVRQINGDKNFAPNVLDEPSKYVSEGSLSEKFAEFLPSMVNYSKRQTIVATHDIPLMEAGDVVYKMTLDKNTGISHVNKVI